MTSILLNPAMADLATRRAVAQGVFTERGYEEAASAIRGWAGYAPTPLLALPGTAHACRVGRVFYKDESPRFGLGSFKALGGAYAAFRLGQQHLVERFPDRLIDPVHLFAAGYESELKSLVLCCATDGNHGRAVAWAAKRLGCKSLIFLHGNVSQGREATLRELGAEVVRVPGTYDDSVEQAATRAAANGWSLVSDTSYAGYTEIPVLVMDGYRLMVQECLDACPELAQTTHVFLQGGVGGLAAAVVAHLLARLNPPPRFVIVEPRVANCLQESARLGRPVRIEGDLDTLMAGLSCGEPSIVAWRVLQSCADAFLTIDDEQAIASMRHLARGAHGDPDLVAGESGAAGHAALCAVGDSQHARALLGIDDSSRILLFGTEGATDPELYRRLINET